VVRNSELAEALFALAESHLPGEERHALLRAGYAVLDCSRELATVRRWPDAVPLEALPTLSMLRSCLTKDALTAAVQRLSGPHRPRLAATRQGFLSAAEVAATLNEPGELLPAELRGAAHWHTLASDGAGSLEVMARRCAQRGASWAVVSDHSRGLACVNGLDAEGVAIQRRGVQAWNRRHGEELQLFQGLEVEVLEDGQLDLPRHARGQLLILAAVHTDLDERKDQTGRLLRAVQEPGVWALAHPRCRLFARRRGLRVNWEVIFKTAAELGVLLEINGFPRRQDLDPTLLQLAVATGCRFLLASDAHHPRHLGFDSVAVAMARLATVPRAAIVSFETAERATETFPVGFTPP
jgi:histidinol phosphatase-like PHP family hydrolase